MSPANGRDLPLTLGERTVFASTYGAEQGRPVLFFHGSPGCRLQAKRMEEAARQTGVTLIALDRPGCGRTSQAEVGFPRQVALDTEAALDALEIDTAGVLAVSGGVAAALTTAGTLHNRVTKVVIGSGLGLLTSRRLRDGAKPGNRLLSVVARRSTVGARVALAPPYLMARLASAIPSQPPDETLRRLIIEMGETFRQGTRGPAVDLANASRVELVNLEAVGQPVVAWHGSQDRHAPLSAMQALMDRLPDSTLHVAEGADHFLMETQAGLLLSELA